MRTTDTAAGAGTAANGLDRRAASGSSGASWESGWQPLSGGALLDRLRVTGRARPSADPVLVADLRAHLGLDASGTVPASTGDADAVTASRIARVLACPAHAGPFGGDDGQPTPARVCGALVDVLFRQWVVTGSFDDPFEDGLGALALDGRWAPLLAWVRSLDPSERAGLRAEVERQADGLRRRWPSLDATWLPRTKQCLRVPAGEGGVALAARVDLAVGRPEADRASVALVDVTSGSPRARHRSDRHFVALVETLRSGVPPFAVATYYTRTGELEVDPVTPVLLVAAARRCRAGILALAAPEVRSDVATPDGAGQWCDACADEPLEPAGPVATGQMVQPLAITGGRRPAEAARGDGDHLAVVPEERAA